MQGTGYAIGEVIIFLVISAIIGFGVGWLLGRWTQRTLAGMEVEDQLTAERERTRQMEARLGERSRDLDGVRTELSRAKRLLAASSLDMSLGEQLVDAQERVSRLEAEGQGKDAEIERLTAAVAELDQARERIGRLEEELTVRGAELDQARERIGHLEEELTVRGAELDQARERIGHLEEELTVRGAELEAARSRVGELEAGLAAATEPEPVVEEPVAEEPVAEEPVVEEPVVEEPVVEEPVVEEPVAEEPVAEEPVAEEPVAEEPVVEEPVVEEPVVEEPVAEEPVAEEPVAEEPVAEEPVAEEPEPLFCEAPTPEEVAALPDKEEATARVAEIAARTAGEGPVSDDDLKRVHGIGPKLERLLKDMGITSYRQIAGFRDDDIAYVAVAIESFPGRIQRDDWMSSAASEHERKYGEPPPEE